VERAGSAVELRPAPKAGRGTDCARPGALDMRRWRCVASGIVNQNGRRFEVLPLNRKSISHDTMRLSVRWLRHFLTKSTVPIGG
jgi:hypothetical protein